MKNFMQLFAGKSNRQRVLYYASHHSLTHVRSAIKIAGLLPEVDFFLLTAEEINFQIPSNVKYYKLPQFNCSVRMNAEIALHRYPYVTEDPDINGFREHSQKFVELLVEISPNLVVVDIYAEIALISKFLGFPTAFFYETIDNSQDRIKSVWRNIDLILVRYPEELIKIIEKEQLSPKMLFAGGVSRFDGMKELSKAEARSMCGIENNRRVVVFLAGSKAHEDAAAKQYFKNIFEAINILKEVEKIVIYPTEDSVTSTARKEYEGIRYIVGREDIFPYLKSADVVISGGGMGVVMECFLANAPLLSLPVPWIFEEQFIKASALQKVGAVLMLDSRSVDAANIHKNVELLLNDETLRNSMVSSQKKLIDGNGYSRISKGIGDLLMTEVCQNKLSLK